MYPALKERFIEIAEEDGWLDEKISKELEKVAINFLRLGRPVEEVAEATTLPLETVKGLTYGLHTVS